MNKLVYVLTSLLVFSIVVSAPILGLDLLLSIAAYYRDSNVPLVWKVLDTSMMAMCLSFLGLLLIGMIVSHLDKSFSNPENPMKNQQPTEID